MARIKNVELPNNKQAYIGLTHIYGIGQATAKKICKAAKVDEGDLRREVQMNIKNKMEINCYQGVRHKKGLPVRGQRTNRNAHTRKGRGKVIANKKK